MDMAVIIVLGDLATVLSGDIIILTTDTILTMVTTLMDITILMDTIRHTDIMDTMDMEVTIATMHRDLIRKEAVLMAQDLELITV